MEGNAALSMVYFCVLSEQTGFSRLPGILAPEIAADANGQRSFVARCMNHSPHFHELACCCYVFNTFATIYRPNFPP